jgi:hypothetical protein
MAFATSACAKPTMVKSSCVDKEKSRHKIEIIDGKKAAQCFN